MVESRVDVELWHRAAVAGPQQQVGRGGKADILVAVAILAPVHDVPAAVFKVCSTPHSAGAHPIAACPRRRAGWTHAPA
eukprot:6947168-Prymnesium_polylepis.1